MAPKTEPTNIFYVKAVPDKDDSQRAKCTFFTDFDCKNKVKPPLSIKVTAGEVIFVGAPTAANWLLVGAVADRVDTTIIDPTFLPASFNQVSVPMPETHVIEQGVLLIFSSQGTKTQLYSSADPTVVNDGI